MKNDMGHNGNDSTGFGGWWAVEFRVMGDEIETLGPSTGAVRMHRV